MRKKIYWLKGVDMSTSMKTAAIRRFIYRFTGDHQPNWVMTYRHMSEQGGMWTHYFEAKPEFIDDREWFERCEFPMADEGKTKFAPWWYQPRHIRFVK